MAGFEGSLCNDELQIVLHAKVQRLPIESDPFNKLLTVTYATESRGFYLFRLFLFLLLRSFSGSLGSFLGFYSG